MNTIEIMSADQKVALALTPVRCMACKQAVPYGWVASEIRCPSAMAGHIASPAVMASVVDVVFNGDN